jgi:hypothetical protein
MHFEKMDRRQLLTVAAGASLGTLLPSAAVTQQPTEKQTPPFAPKDAGPIHNDMLTRIGAALHGTEILTSGGLKKVVGLLVEFNVVSKDDGDLLNRLIDAIFSSEQTMAREIEQLYAEAVKKAHDVTVAIVSVARSSFEYAKNNPRIVDIVAQDLLGALSGAYTGMKLGGPFVLAGALLGAVGNSAYAVWHTAGKPVSSLRTTVDAKPATA